MSYNCKDVVNVVFISDENYIQPTIIAITSLLKNKTDSKYRIYVIGNNVTEKSRDLLLSLNDSDDEVIYLETENAYKNMSAQGLKANLSANVTALIKFDLANILSDVDKVLYLDGDIIINRDLKELYNVRLKENYIAAVNNYYPLSHIQRLGLKSQHDYYNTGVMLMDLKRMREDGMCSKLVEYRNNCYNKFMDQDAFNVVFAGKILTLPLIYNMRFDCIAYPNFDEIIHDYYGMQEGITCRELVERSVILHFCTKQKPWIYQIPFFSELYLGYYNISPYENTKRELGNYKFGQPLRPVEIKSDINFGSVDIGVFVNVSEDVKNTQLCVNSLLYQTINNVQIHLMIKRQNVAAMEYALQMSNTDSRVIIHLVDGNNLDEWKSPIADSDCGYFIFIDSNDYLEQNACEFLAAIIDKENPDVIVYHPREFNSEFSKFENIQNFKDKKSHSIFRYYAKLYYSFDLDDNRTKFICNNLAYPCSMAYKREILLNSLNESENFSELFFKSAFNHELLLLNLILVNHRNDSESDFYKQFNLIKVKGNNLDSSPVVSVVTAAYNCEKYIGEMLRSLVKQTQKNIQIICVDDGSTDNTLGLMLDYADRDDRIMVLRSAMNVGPAVARNYGLDHAVGDYVIFVDADDYCDITMLERMVAASKLHNADVVICRSYEFDDKTGEQTYNSSMYREELLPDKNKPFNYRDVPQYIFNIVNGWAWDKLIKREILLKHKLNFQDIRRNEDMVFSYMSMIYADSNFLMDDVLIFHRRNTGTSQEKTGLQYPYTFYDAGLEWIKKLNEAGVYDMVEQSYVNRIISAVFYTLSMVKNDSALYLELLVYCKLKILSDLRLLNRKQDYFYEFNQDRFYKLSRIETQSLYEILREELESAQNKLKSDYKIINDKLNWYRREKEKADRDRQNNEISGKAHKRTKLMTLAKKFFAYLKKNGLRKTIRRILFGKKPMGRRVKNLIVSLTSFPARIKTVHLCVETLLNQTLKPEKVILVLAEEQFPHKEADLPRELIEQTKRGLSIMWDKDIKSYKKLIPVKKAFPKAIIVTADDDVYYRYDWLRSLYDAYKKNPKCIHCHRASKIIIDGDKVQMITGGEDVYREPSYLNKLTGVGGVLYPADCFYKDILNEELFMKLCPHNDDTWFWLMGALNGYKVNVIKHNDISLNFIGDTQEGPCLWKVNNRQTNYFYKELDNMFEYYADLHLKELLLNDQTALDKNK